MNEPMTAARPAVPSLSCVMPAFNEAESLPRVVPAVLEHLLQLSPRVELILIDDGSSDATAVVATDLCQRHPQIVLLQLARNFGKEAALAAGLQATHGDVVVIMDADGQHPVELVDEMLRLWRDDGVDDVYAVRSRQGQSRLYAFGVRVFYRLINWGMRFRVPPDAGDFRLLDRRVVQVLNALPERHRFTKGLYAWAGFKSVAIPYDPLARVAGHSNFGWRASLAFGATGLLSFTAAPLRFFGLIGLALALVSIGYGAWVVIEHFVWGARVRGYATIVTGIMFLSGVQLLAIGLLAEYVARIYDEVKGRPLYWIARRVGTGLAPREHDSGLHSHP
ncbi:MAG: glycosyltransferase [Burkholderiaceae bacterium]|nr:MAG: glycosyltransferase [Burkholderiaceae bacterium]